MNGSSDLPLLHVASPSTCNMQQMPVLEDFHATSHATVVQQASLKALATHALIRNMACNKDATQLLSTVQQKLFKKYVFVARKNHPEMADIDVELLALDALLNHQPGEVDHLLHVARTKECNMQQPFKAADSLDCGRASLPPNVASHFEHWMVDLTKLSSLPRPKQIHSKRWDTILDHVQLLIHSPDLIIDLIAHNWSLHDIMGCHPTHPEQRYNYMGLLLSLKDRVIESIQPHTITLKCPSGAFLKHYKNKSLPVGQILLTELNLDASYAFDERAAIMEFDGRASREEAERYAIIACRNANF